MTITFDDFEIADCMSEVLGFPDGAVVLASPSRDVPNGEKMF